MTNRIKSLALAALLLGATSAYAATYSLTVPNDALSSHAGPYGTVNVSLNSAKTVATIDFLANAGFLFVDGGSAAVNINASSFSVGSIVGTNTNAGFTPGPYTTASGQEDGFGRMNLQIDSFDSYTHGATEISFMVTNLLGWNNENSVLMANTDGTLAAAHIAVCSSNPCSITGNALITGYAGNGGSVPQPAVPEPSSLILLGTGIVGVAGAIRRRFASSFNN